MVKNFKFKKGEVEFYKELDIIQLLKYEEDFPNLKKGIEEFKELYFFNRMEETWVKKN